MDDKNLVKVTAIDKCMFVFVLPELKAYNPHTDLTILSSY